jgi:general secretion pathway protein B
MSFILDALKKSEVERQRQAIPGLMDSRPVPPRARFPLWAAALIALLVVNMGVLAVVLMRSGAHGGAAAERSAQPAPAASATSQTRAVTAARAGSAGAAPAPGPSGSASAAPDHFSPMDAAPPVYAPEVPPTQDASSPAAARRSARAGSSSDAGIPRRAAPGADPLLTGSSDPSDTEVLPSINEIDLANQPALAGLHLDVHVYATQPSERFVYINMRKYREGSTLAEGPVLEHIRRDGVVLNYQGLRFVLPRQQ